MRLVIHPDVQAEIVEAVDWYEQRAIGLGQDLLVEIEAALEAIVEQPRTWPAWPSIARIMCASAGSAG